MQPQDEPPRNVTAVALIVEIGLAVAAFALAWLFGRLPLRGIDFRPVAMSENVYAAVFGVAATVPLLLLLLVLNHSQFGPFVTLRKLVAELVIPLFRDLSVAEIALISIAAGVGEEIFFRAFLQTAIADLVGSQVGIVVGLVAASALFGVCHWLNGTYALLATTMGLYFGWLFLASDNLVVPMTAHALYDFIALIYLTRFS